MSARNVSALWGLAAVIAAAGCKPTQEQAGQGEDEGETPEEAAEAEPPAGDRPHIVFITSDDHSVPDLGVYGNDKVTSPNMDRLAEAGIRFDRAYVSSPQCSPSRVSLMTGRTPTATNNSRLHSPLDPEHDNLVRAMNEAGYFTAAFRKIHVGEEVEGEFDFREGEEDVPFSAALDAWDGEQPLYLHIGFNEPHRPYEAGQFEPPHDPDEVQIPEFLPDTPQVRAELAMYYDEIAEMDRQIGELMELLEEQGIADDTLILFAGDNGMPFPGAKGTLYEPGVRVPLFAHWPGEIPAGQVSEEVVSLVDLVPTMLEAAGIEPWEMEGRSLLSHMREDGVEGVREYAFTERNWHDNLDLSRAVHGARYKLIRNYLHDRPYEPTMDIRDSSAWESMVVLNARGELEAEHAERYFAPRRPAYELFDLEQDPLERENLADSPNHADIRDELEAALTEWMKSIGDPLPPPHGELPPKAVKALKEQGVDPKELFR